MIRRIGRVGDKLTVSEVWRLGHIGEKVTIKRIYEANQIVYVVCEEWSSDHPDHNTHAKSFKFHSRP